MRHIRPASAADLDAMSQLAAECQRLPESHCIYLSSDPEPIAHEVASVADWTANTRVLEADGALIAWLLAEVDPEMRRVWWWGPFVSQGEPFEDAAGPLYDTLRSDLGSRVTEEEMAADTRNVDLERFAAAHGFDSGTASSVLSCFTAVDASSDGVRPLERRDHPSVIALHEAAFPGTHTPGPMLVEPRPDTRVLVADDQGVVTGYIACQRSADEDGYIDFLAVDPERRGAGIGARLVASAVGLLRDEGAGSVHLTVREDNHAARSLYRRLGFVEERLVRPYRRGFDLG